MVDLKTSHKILIVIAILIGLSKLSKIKLPKFRNTTPTPPRQPVVSTPHHIFRRYDTYDSIPQFSVRETPRTATTDRVLVQHLPNTSLPMNDVRIMFADDYSKRTEETTTSRSSPSMPKSSGGLCIDDEAYDRYCRNR